MSFVEAINAQLEHLIFLKALTLSGNFLYNVFER